MAPETPFLFAQRVVDATLPDLAMLARLPWALFNRFNCPFERPARIFVTSSTGRVYPTCVFFSILLSNLSNTTLIRMIVRDHLDNSLTY